jgi:hypothetical protein
VEALPKATRGEALERLKTQESTGPAGGLNRRLLVANSQGEQGPEDAGLTERAFGRVEARSKRQEGNGRREAERLLGRKKL